MTPHDSASPGFVGARIGLLWTGSTATAPLDGDLNTQVSIQHWETPKASTAHLYLGFTTLPIRYSSTRLPN